MVLGGRGAFWLFMQTFLFHASVTETQAGDIFLELICGVCICNQKQNTIGLKIERSWWVEVSNSSQRNLSLALRISQLILRLAMSLITGWRPTTDRDSELEILR